MSFLDYFLFLNAGSISWEGDASKYGTVSEVGNTVDGRNPAPPDMYETL